LKLPAAHSQAHLASFYNLWQHLIVQRQETSSFRWCYAASQLLDVTAETLPFRFALPDILYASYQHVAGLGSHNLWQCNQHSYRCWFSSRRILTNLN
jgi:hypothetical protein